MSRPRPEHAAPRDLPDGAGPRGASVRAVPRSLLGRFLALSALWIAAVLCVAWLVIGGVLDRFVVARFSDGLQATSDSLLARLSVQGDALTLENRYDDPRFSRPLSGWYWQIETAGVDPLVSESLFLDQVLPPYVAGPDGQALLARQRDVTIAGWDDDISILVTAPQAEVDAALSDVRGPLLWSLVALGAGLAALAVVQGALALAGFRHIGAGIAAIRDGRSDRLARRGLREVDAPVDEINSLLDQNRAVLTRARNHVGNLAHALKTPLAALLNDAAPGSDAAHTANRMDRLIRYHLRRARGAGSARLLGARTPVLDVAEDIMLVLRGMARDRGIALGVDVPEDLDFAGEREDMEEIIGNLAENAVQWASSRVDVTARRDGRVVVMAITDDGPGIPADSLSRVLARGGRLDESVAGSGLGLGIVADLVALNDGTLEFLPAAGSGLRVEVRLPRSDG